MIPPSNGCPRRSTVVPHRPHQLSCRPREKDGTFFFPQFLIIRTASRGARLRVLYGVMGHLLLEATAPGQSRPPRRSGTTPLLHLPARLQLHIPIYGGDLSGFRFLSSSFVATLGEVPLWPPMEVGMRGRRAVPGTVELVKGGSFPFLVDQGKKILSNRSQAILLGDSFRCCCCCCFGCFSLGAIMASHSLLLHAPTLPPRAIIYICACTVCFSLLN